MGHCGIVVGDCFSGFSSVEGVFTVSELARHLRQLGGTDRFRSKSVLPEYLVWGQGISENDRAYIAQLIDHAPSPIAISLADWPPTVSATRGHVHKHAPQNVLISVPKRIDENCFLADLQIDARNELLLDHVTGLHVQGMVLTEAIRQMFLAVSEEHLFDENTPAETYFAIKSMTVDYKSFVFPVGASLLFKTDQLKRSDDGRLSVTASIGVWQGEVECATSKVSFSVFDAHRLKTREIELADDCVRKFLRARHVSSTVTHKVHSHSLSERVAA